MWIICKNGTAVNSDAIRKIYECDGVHIDCGAAPNPIVTDHDNGTIEQIVRNIVSGEKFMDFREGHDYD